MQVKTAKSAGFCFGVQRAVDTVYEQADAGYKPIYTYGPIIHNEVVVRDLEEKGVHVLNSREELEQLAEGTVIIRSHGVGKEIYDLIQDKGLICVDATCPFVKKIHRIVEKESAAGRHIIIIGNDRHPVIENAQQAETIGISEGTPVCIVSQTTFNYKKFQDLVEILDKKRYDRLVVNTICNATEERQTEARQIAGEADAMIVIGGSHSSNTQKLFEICKKECADTFYIQTVHDLNLEVLRSTGLVGITAGASTPKKIIEEVQKHVADLSFEQMLEDSLKTIRTGEIVEGTVIDVKEDEIILNIGYKSDGIVSRSEYTNVPNADLTAMVHVGDTMEVKVLKVNDGEGQVQLSYRRVAAERGSKRLEEAFENKEVLKAKVSQVLDGGLSVVVDETRIFIPASLVSDTYEKNLGKYADQEIEFVITEFNPKRRRIIGDRRQLLVAKKAEMQKELFARIHEGDVVEGTVKNVTDFGAFIDLGGADGLLHISEMSWGRVEHPKKLFKVGDKVKVLIKEIKDSKIALSMKFEDSNPWLTADEKYAVGNVVEGTVARMTDFGAFVELEPGVDALLHVSQISKEHVDKPSDVLKIGQVITAKVVDFNGEDRKISLSMKALENNEAESDQEEETEE